MPVTRDLRIEHPRGGIFARIWQMPGSAAPIVLFHDSLGCVELWRGFPAALARATARTVIAYDRLGFGRSDPRHEPPEPGFIANEAATWLPVLRAQAGFDRFLAFGHSVGGGMALHAAAAFPDGCAAVITSAAQAFLEPRTLEGIRETQRRFEDGEQFARLARYHGAKARWVLDAWTGTWLDPDFAAWTLAPVLPRVTCPVLAIHGLRDEYGSPRHAEMITRLAAGPTRLELLPEAGHFPHREQEQEVTTLVAAFLATA